jgi:hypothetical protein
MLLCKFLQICLNTFILKSFNISIFNYFIFRLTFRPVSLVTKIARTSSAEFPSGTFIANVIIFCFFIIYVHFNNNKLAPLYYNYLCASFLRNFYKLRMVVLCLCLISDLAHLRLPRHKIDLFDYLIFFRL